MFQTGNQMEDMCAGNYRVTVSDINGCEAENSISLTDPSTLRLVPNITQVSCYNQCDGAISVTPISGAPPFRYNWENGFIGPVRSNLCAGVYSVTVMDGNGNQYSDWITLENPDSLSVNPIVASEICPSGCNGSIYLNVQGGTAPYSYLWSNGATTQTVSSVCAGNYTATITDARGCSLIENITVTGPATMTSAVSVNNPITCNDSCNGDISILLSGGTAPYRVLWEDGSTDTSLTNLCAGTYNYTVTDTNNCSSFFSFTLTEPAAISPNATIDSSNCGLGNGQISLNPTGGVLPYSYAWTGVVPNPGNSSLVSNLFSGSYTVTVSDASGCERSFPFTVNDSAGPTDTNTIVVLPSCIGQADGSISISPAGGISPYSVVWSNGAIGNTASGLTSGLYSVTVFDAAGCQFVKNIKLNDPTPIETNGIFSNVSCNGLCNGGIALTPSGGSGSYNILWSNGSTAPTIGNLCPGGYGVTVTDGNGCSVTDTFTITEPPALLIDSIVQTKFINCFGDCEGEAVVYASSGSPPYRYSWNTGSNSSTGYNLCGGVNSVTVIDSRGCVATDVITITEPPAVSLALSQTQNVGCSGTWLFEWDDCCRNNQNIHNTNTTNMYNYAIMNATLPLGDCPNSITFPGDTTGGAKPIEYVCIDSAYCYFPQVTNISGDSLVFILAPALQAANTPIIYNPTYSATNPINNMISFDSITGQICFDPQDPPGQGSYIVDFLVKQYDRITGHYKGEVNKDIQFIATHCGNRSNAPFSTLPYLKNFSTTGSAFLSDTTEITMCEGDDFTFEMTFYDYEYDSVPAPNPSTPFIPKDFLRIKTNVKDVLNGPNVGDTAVVSLTPETTISWNPPTQDSVLTRTITISWTAPANSAKTYIFGITADDDHCDIPQTTTIPIRVKVVGSTYAGPDQIICGAEQAQLVAGGGSEFGWRALSGDSIIVGTNFSCDSCHNPVATPSQTTVYEVTSDLVSTCKNKDTVKVSVVADYIPVSGPDTVLCNPDTIPMWASSSIGTSGFSYVWRPKAGLSSDTVQNPIADVQRTTTYLITMTSDSGCVRNTQHTITVLPPFPNISLTTSPDDLCGTQDTAMIIADFGYGNVTCGPAQALCQSSTGSIDVGNFTSPIITTANGYPTPYGNDNESAKHQFLYRASELTAANLDAGMITGMGFDVFNTNGSPNYTNYTIRMECTSLSTFGPAFQTVTNVVLNNASFTLTPGWNMHQFTTPFMWDGTSNIIVEICFNMPSSNANASVYAQTTSSPAFNSALYDFSNVYNTCSQGVANTPSFVRPNTRFEFCEAMDTAAYTYSWFPKYNIASDSTLNPLVWPDSTTDYTIIVNDTFGVCADTASITVFYGRVDAGKDTTICPSDTIQLSATSDAICPSGGTTYTWFPTTGLSNANISNPMVNTQVTRTYFVTYTNACGCTSTDSVTIFIEEFNPPVTILTPPECGFDDGIIEVLGSGGFRPYMYSIDSGSTFVNDSIFDSLAMGYYGIMIKDSLGCLSVINHDTLVNPGAPKIDSVVTTDPSCFGLTDGIVNIFSQGGTPPLTFSVDDTNFFPSNIFDTLGPGVYPITVMDDTGCINFPPVSVELFAQPEIISDTVFITDLQCFGDSSGVISITALGGIQPLQYSIDSGLTFQPLGLFEDLPSDTYYIVIKDSAECAVKARAVFVDEPPELLVTMDVQNDTCYNACGGQASAIVTGGIPPYTYDWNGYGGNTPTSLLLCAGKSYQLSVTDANGCDYIAGFDIDQPDPLVFDSLLLQNPSCYSSNDGVIQVFSSGGTGSLRYSIDNGNSFFFNPVFTGLDAGIYEILVIDSGDRCMRDTTVILSKPTQIVVTPDDSAKTICAFTCTPIGVSAFGGNNVYTYHWNEGLSDTSQHLVCPTDSMTVYTVFVTDSSGCASAPTSITILLHDSLNIETEDDQIICLGDSVLLFADASGGTGTGYGYVWSPSASMINPTSAGPIAFPTQPTTYSVTVSNECGTTTGSVFVDIFPQPQADFLVEDTNVGCSPFEVTLINLATPVQLAKWTIGTEISAVGQTARIAGLLTGSYDVRLEVTSPDGCEDAIVKEDYIVVEPSPEAIFDMAPDEVTNIDTRVVFTDLSEGEVVSWLWDFGGLSTSEDQNPEFIFPPDTGDYTITLEVASLLGCTDETFRILHISSEFNFYVPNSFTPDGDGLNDVFAPQGIGVSSEGYTLQIYNRQGTMIFESKSPNIPWDGKMMGSDKMAPVGVYVWRIVLRDATENTQTHEYKGTISLIR
jgi:gliding motility-associated-like protein